MAFPSISTGIHGYPLDKARKIGVSTIRNFEAALQVTMVASDEGTYRAFESDVSKDSLFIRKTDRQAVLILHNI